MLSLYIFIILQILVESFPVSSSGHTALFSRAAISLGYQLPSIIYTAWFNHLLHLPTMIIVSLFFMDNWRPLMRYPFRYRHILLRLIGIVFIADAITVLFYGVLKLLGTQWFPLGVGFVITGLLLFSLQLCTESADKKSWIVVAVILGCAQGVALLPGISRFAATYTAARWLGIKPQKSFYLSWLLQWPLIVVASAHGLLGLYVWGLSFELLHPTLWLVILGASIAAWYGLCLVYRMALNRQLYLWCYYMSVPWLIWLFLVIHTIADKGNL